MRLAVSEPKPGGDGDWKRPGVRVGHRQALGTMAADRMPNAVRMAGDVKSIQPQMDRMDAENEDQDPVFIRVNLGSSAV
jgi:hypothetical protein